MSCIHIFIALALLSFSSTSSGLAKLSKAGSSAGPLKQQQGEKKETPQERLKRIMSRQLNKQSMAHKFHQHILDALPTVDEVF